MLTKALEAETTLAMSASPGGRAAFQGGAGRGGRHRRRERRGCAVRGGGAAAGLWPAAAGRGAHPALLPRRVPPPLDARRRPAEGVLPKQNKAPKTKTRRPKRGFLDQLCEEMPMLGGAAAYAQTGNAAEAGLAGNMLIHAARCRASSWAGCLRRWQPAPSAASRSWAARTAGPTSATT